MSIRQFAAQRPVLAAVLCAGLQFALTILILKAGFAFAPPEAHGKVKLAAFASTLLLPLLLTQAFGVWRQVGFELDRLRPAPFFLACLLPALVFLSLGVRQPEQGAIGADLLVQLLNAFGEELLFRGVIFVILLSLPQWKAIVMNGLLFGSMHLIHGYMDGNWSAALSWAFMSSIAGMMFTAARYRTGSLWLLVFLHMVLNLASMYSNVEAVAGPTGAEVAKWLVKALELALAVYAMTTWTRHQALHPVKESS